MKNYNCYIHIPFCTSKCKYCRFASFSGLNELKVNTYVDFLCNEITNPPPNLLPKIKDGGLNTIYFGGGTPGILTLKQFEKILNNLKSKYNFSENIEISIESTPENISKENISGWKKLGINRLSIGVQSLNEKTLSEIGRSSKGDILKALDNIKEVGFDNVSIDFIIGLPYVKPHEVKENLKFLLEKYSFVKHVSVYMLEEYYDVPIDKESKFENIIYPNNWNKLGISEEDYLEEYIEIKNFLKENGIYKYEISNFAKPGYECKHNQGYWEHKETLAFGLGAFGFLKTSSQPSPHKEKEQEEFIRFSKSEDFLEYYNYKNIVSEKLSNEDIFLEKIMFDLRTSGIEEYDIEKLNQEKIHDFIKDGFLEKNKTKIQITNKGTLVLDYILSEIL